MERLRLHLIATSLLISTALFGCVSVDLAKPSVQRSEHIQYQDPHSDFEERDSQHLDKLWIHEKSGNSISFLSDCNNRVDPPLQKIRDGVIKGLEDKELLTEKMERFNRRKSLRSLVSGSVDGIKTRLDLIVFKKNSCIYIITYGAVESQFSQGSKAFQTFLTGFKVP